MERLGTWQTWTTLKISVSAPPIAALIVTIAGYLPSWLSHPERIDPGSFIFTFTLFSVPAAYALGILPALIGAALYCLALTARPVLRNFVWRSALGLIIGAVVGSAWCYFVLGLPTWFYGIIVSGVPSLVLAMLWPTAAQRRPLTIGSSERGVSSSVSPGGGR